MGGILSYFARGWRGESESSETLVSKPNSGSYPLETALTNPILFDTLNDSPSSPQDKYTRLLTSIESTDSGSDTTNTNKLFQERTIDLPVLTDGERYQEINAIATAVLRLYKPIEERKATIRKSLISFKEAIGLDEDSTIFSCFKVLRSKFGPTMRLELVCAGKEPIKLKLTDVSSTAPPEVDSDVKRAISSLNTCLNQCQKYWGEKELRLTDVQVQLEDLQLMPLTKEGQSLYAAISETPSYIEELAKDINLLLIEMYKAKDTLRPQ